KTPDDRRARSDPRHEFPDIAVGRKVELRESGPAKDGPQIGVRGGESLAGQEGFSRELLFDMFQAPFEVRAACLLRFFRRARLEEWTEILVQFRRYEGQPLLDPVALHFPG